jgi:hypothetical protein
MFGQDRNWLELAEKTNNKVKKDQIDRDTKEKPVKKKKDDYILQF